MVEGGGGRVGCTSGMETDFALWFAGGWGWWNMEGMYLELIFSLVFANAVILACMDMFGGVLEDKSVILCVRFSLLRSKSFQQRNHAEPPGANPPSQPWHTHFWLTYAFFLSPFFKIYFITDLNLAAGLEILLVHESTYFKGSLVSSIPLRFQEISFCIICIVKSYFFCTNGLHLFIMCSVVHYHWMSLRFTYIIS